MKNTLVKNIAAIVLIGCTVIFSGCSSTSAKIQKNRESILSSAESIDRNPKESKEVLDLKVIEAKISDELILLADKLSKAEDVNSINNILIEYYESNRANTANIFFAQESGGFYLNPKDILPQDYDARKREWYIQTIKNTNYISKQYEDLLNGRNIITFARVVAKDNINIGVIGIDKFID
jgi:methyl-accepting chemotaxis protein